MGKYENYSRMDKFSKRRKNTKALSISFVIGGGLLIVALIGLFILGGDDEEIQPENQASQTTGKNSDDPSKDIDESEEDENVTSNNDSKPNQEVSSNEDSDETNQENSPNENGQNANVENETRLIETEKENVVKAYTADWEPIGTKQEGPHTTVFDTESQDWKEMENAIRLATGLEQGDMITWRIENGGHQKVIGTVSNKAQTVTYRTYLTWVENQGWKPTKVEVLKENDKKNID